jgi:multiple sugar transport system ATP-binding protein
VFVAGFIGSPPMNLFRARAANGRVTIGSLELDGLRAPDGEVVVGIRPEGLRPVGDGHAGPAVEVAVDVIEPLGDEVLVHGSIDARPAENPAAAEEATLLSDAGLAGRAAIVLRLRPEERPEAGALLRVAISLASVRMFDASSGLAIRPG